MDHFETLGVSPLASLQEIRAAYLKRALELHPDKGGSKAAFQKLVAAFEALSDGSTKLLQLSPRSSSSSSPSSRSPPPSPPQPVTPTIPPARRAVPPCDQPGACGRAAGRPHFLGHGAAQPPYGDIRRSWVRDREKRAV